MRSRFVALCLLLTLFDRADAQPPVVPSGPPGNPPDNPPGIELPAPPNLTRQYRELIPRLMDALRDSDAEVRQYSALALAGLGEEVIGPLSRALEDPNKDMRSAAAYALGQMGFSAHTAIPALLRALKDEEPAVRRAAAHAISRITSRDGFWEVPVARPLAPGLGRGVGANVTPAANA
ncbi:MAG: HEAT repeat domain-containing protein, partial [Gemmataceae bacterium]|nr:HEAT repeat domain-containing protein [Gemmataceae bacterium]